MSEKEIVVQVPKAIQKFQDSIREAVEIELTRIWLDEHFEDAKNYTVRIKISKT